MTTDNSLPDVLIDWSEKGAIAYEVGDYTGAPMIRYTPAASAEATIKSLRDALRTRLVTDYYCELCDRGWEEPNVEHHAPGCLLAKDASG